MTVSKIQSPYTPLETTEKTNEIIDQLNTNTGAIAALKDVPTGSVIPFAGSTAPTGFLICDGSAISRTTYADLFAVIGTTYGSGDGSTTFNLPNLQDRIPQGAGTRGSIGNYVPESLPNIRAVLPHNFRGMATYPSSGTETNGAFMTEVTSSGQYGGSGTTYRSVALSFSANRDNSTYQDNAPVQQDAVCVNYCIKY